MRSADARFVVAEPELLPTVRAAGDACGIPAANYWVFDVLPTHAVPAGYRSWRALLAGGECDWVRLDTAGPATTAMRLFSSGTTGLPKAANISHQNLIAQNMAVTEFRLRDYEVPSTPPPLYTYARVRLTIVANILPAAANVPRGGSANRAGVGAAFGAACAGAAPLRPAAVRGHAGCVRRD